MGLFSLLIVYVDPRQEYRPEPGRS